MDVSILDIFSGRALGHLWRSCPPHPSPLPKERVNYRPPLVPRAIPSRWAPARSLSLGRGAGVRGTEAAGKEKSFIATCQPTEIVEEGIRLLRHPLMAQTGDKSDRGNWWDCYRQN